MRRALSLSILLTALASAALAPPCYAQDDAAIARGRELFDNGRDLYNEGLYAESILSFEEAYRLTGRHELLLNVASAQERMGDTRGAIDTLNRYRAFAPSADREALERRIRNLERRLEEDQAQPAPVAAVPVAAAPVAATPAPVESAPAASLPAPTPLPEPLAAGTVSRPRWGLAAGGAAAALSFGGAAALTWGLSQSWIESGDQATYEAVRPLNTASLALAGAGGGVAILGLVLRTERPTASASFTPWVAPTANAVVLGASFSPALREAAR